MVSFTHLFFNKFVVVSSLNYYLVSYLCKKCFPNAFSGGYSFSEEWMEINITITSLSH